MKNLKVCIVTDSFFGSGGIATSVRELSSHLALKGVKVHIVTFENSNKYPPKHLRIVKVGSPQRPFALWGLTETSFRASRIIDAFRARARDDLLEDFDLIHFHGPTALAGLFTSKCADVPWLVTVHGTFQKERAWLRSYPKANPDLLRYCIGTYIFTVFESWMYKSLSSRVHFIAVSQQTRDDLVRMRVHEDRVFVVPNGVDTNLYRPIPIDRSRMKLGMEKRIGPDEKVVLSVNFVEPRKGMHILVKAFHEVLKEVSNAHCVIVGASTLNGYRQYLLRLAINLGLEGKIHFTGFVAEETLPYYFGSCDVFALPSLAEGAPLVIPMAMACRKPVVATTASAAKEYLEPECTIKPGDYGELAEKLAYYLANEKEADNLADRLYRKAIMNLTWDKVANETITVYEKILEGTTT
jgi:glycosyltransferase involved in cell wall biosynthesis